MADLLDVSFKDKISRDLRLKDLAVKFKDLVHVVDHAHLLDCPCHKSLIDSEFQRLWPIEFKRIQEEGKEHDVFIVNSRKSSLRTKILKSVSEKMIAIDKRCPLEFMNVKNSLELFVDSHYDLNNPIVFGIIKKTLEQELVSFRLNMKLKDDSLLIWREGREGSGEWMLNPVVEANRRASESIIKAFETLSKVTDGTKSMNTNVNVDLQGRVFSREELYGNMKNITQEDSDDIV